VTEEPSVLQTQTEPKDYEKEVEKLASIYPNIRKRVYKTAKRSWKEVYEKMLDIIQKAKK
jgi:glutathionyl-hydroquinone reductase